MNQLQDFILLHDPHILVVTETWLSSKMTDSEVPPSHNIVRRDGDGRRGGGAVIVKKEIKCVLADHITDHESIWCKISNRDFSTLLGVVYRSPEVPYSRSKNWLVIMSGW